MHGVENLVFSRFFFFFFIQFSIDFIKPILGHNFVADIVRKLLTSDEFKYWWRYCVTAINNSAQIVHNWKSHNNTNLYYQSSEKPCFFFFFFKEQIRLYTSRNCTCLYLFCLYTDNNICECACLCDAAYDKSENYYIIFFAYSSKYLISATLNLSVRHVYCIFARSIRCLRAPLSFLFSRITWITTTAFPSF